MLTRLNFANFPLQPPPPQVNNAYWQRKATEENVVILFYSFKVAGEVIWYNNWPCENELWFIICYKLVEK